MTSLTSPAVLTRGLELKKLIGTGTALVFVLAACGDDSGEEDSGTGDATDDQEETEEPTATPALFGDACTDNSTYVVQAKHAELEQVDVYAEPDGEVLHSFDSVWTTVENPQDPEAGTTLTFVLTEESELDGEWLHVDLPLPVPDSDATQAYVRAEDVTGYCHELELTISLSEFSLELTDAGEVLTEATVGLGRDERATQPGEYFTTELVQSDDPEGAYGPYAFALNSFPDDPDVVAEFGGENGIATTGLHGTNEPDALGTNVSSGCIRMDNDTVTDLAETAVEYDGTPQGLPLGVPVHVVA